MTEQESPLNTPLVLTQVVLQPQLDEASQECDLGVLLRLADDAAFMASIRYCRGQKVFTAQMADFEVDAVVRCQDLVRCAARVIATGTRSILVETILTVSRLPYICEEPLGRGEFVTVLTEADYSPLHVPLLSTMTDAARERLAFLKRASADELLLPE